MSDLFSDARAMEDLARAIRQASDKLAEAIENARIGYRGLALTDGEILDDANNGFIVQRLPFRVVPKER